MIKTAEAFLSGRYNYQERGSSPVVPMVNIEIVDTMGRSIMMLKAEDNPETIENLLWIQGWRIIKRDGNILSLQALNPKEISAPDSISLIKEEPVSSKPQKKSHRKEILVLIALIFIIFGAIFALGRVDPTEKEPDVGNPLIAEAECHKAVLAELDTMDASINNSQVINDTRFPTHYQVVGSAKTGKESGQVRDRSFSCDINYSPDLKKWDAKVSFGGGN